MEQNEIQQIASKFINHTNKIIFLTGKAGTGKTTFLKNIINTTHKKTVVVAPTGIAAINAGGTTIHSLFQLPFGSYIPSETANQYYNQNNKINSPLSVIKNLQMSNSKRNLLREIELIIIDEVSMLRADLLDAIDLVLRHIRRKQFEAFGGVQVLFIGDLQQLPPVINDTEWSVLKNFYKSIFFFDALVLQKTKPIYLELEKIYRQNDQLFINLLNNLRNNTITNNDEQLLNKYYKPDFKPNASQNYITLTTHNYKANNLNKQKLTELKSPSFYYNAVVTGDFNEYSYPIDFTLELKVGAQVMFIKNDTSFDKRYYNGKIGVVSVLNEDVIEVDFNDNSKPVKVEKHEWQNIKYKLNDVTNEIEENVIGSFTHFPIKLAWAITVHKSQGLTFEKAIIDVQDAFAAGQIYVALSRLTSLNGLVLNSKINFNSIQNNSDVESFANNKEETDTLNSIIKKETISYSKEYLFQCFDFNYLSYLLKKHLDSYSKDEKKSIKQKYVNWAKELASLFDEQHNNAQKFVSQLNTLYSENNVDLFQKINIRVEAANKYFAPILKKMSSKINLQIEAIKDEKKIKQYITELLDLEINVYEQLKKINKSEQLIKAILENKELNKQEIALIELDNERVKEKSTLVLPPEIKEKKKKIDTKLETIQLYYDGKTPKEIAEIRALTLTTIEGHLAYYVAKGEIKATDFISETKINQITETYKKHPSFQLGELKQHLGSEFSYSEIKIALAHIVQKA